MSKRVLLLFFMAAFVAGLSAAVLAQVPAQSGFTYSVGYSLEIQVNSSTVYSTAINASLAGAGTNLIAFDYPLTLNMIANNYSSVQAGQGGAYVFPPVTETITETRTYTTTVVTTVVSGTTTTMTKTVPVGPTSTAISSGGKEKAVAAGILAVLLLLMLLAAARR